MTVYVIVSLFFYCPRTMVKRRTVKRMMKMRKLMKRRKRRRRRLSLLQIRCKRKRKLQQTQCRRRLHKSLIVLPVLLRNVIVSLVSQS